MFSFRGILSLIQLIPKLIAAWKAAIKAYWTRRMQEKKELSREIREEQEIATTQEERQRAADRLAARYGNRPDPDDHKS